jgi:hypothetical protein
MNLQVWLLQLMNFITFQTRDLSIAYLLVTLTYALIGVLFYICFPLHKICISDVSTTLILKTLNQQ